MQFNQLGLSQTVLAALAAKGYTEATPIQAQSIPSLLEGRDLLGIAQTGTGKTAAFMLPSIDRLIASGKRAQPRGCRMLVLAPTRELASQIAESARAYAKGTPLSVATDLRRHFHSQEQDRSRPRHRHRRRHSGPPRRPDGSALRDPARHRDPRARRSRPDDGSGLHPRLEADRPRPAVEAPDPVLLGDDAQDDPRARRPVHQGPGRGQGDARSDHRRARRAARHLRGAGRETGAADDGAARSEHRPRADLHPHQARRRPRRATARGQRHRVERDPRQQEPAAA